MNREKKESSGEWNEQVVGLATHTFWCALLNNLPPDSKQFAFQGLDLTLGITNVHIEMTMVP